MTIQSGAGEDLYLKNGTFAALYASNTTVYLASITHAFTATTIGFRGNACRETDRYRLARRNAALASLLTSLANLGLITDSTTA